MKKLKYYLLIPLLTICVGLAAQEICDNGIDDDLDGLIDLNDDECDCNNDVRPLTDIIGEGFCTFVTIAIQDPDGISYQWYHDGVALSGQTSFALSLNQFQFPEGEYVLVVQTATGCYSSEPYIGSLEPRVEDLGIVYICPPECFLVDGYPPICVQGTQSFNLQTVDGCDSTLYVNIVVGGETTSTLDTVICSGQTFEYYDVSTTTAGQYTAIGQNWFGCDSIITVNLTVLPEIPKTINASICQGDTYTDYGFNLTESGSASTVISGNGDCDTLLTVMLNVLDPVEGSFPQTICAGQSYTDFGLDVNVSGLYPVDTIPASTGCDSIVSVDLTVLDPLSSNISESICFGETFMLHGLEATESGDYEVTIQNAQGCDSTIYVALTVDEQIVTSMDDTFCEGDTYVFYDIMATAPGLYEQVFTATNGCDSTVVINLQMNPVNMTDLGQEYVCAGDAFVLHDIYATESGIYYDTLYNSYGCDSILMVEVVVNDEVLVTFNPEVCEGDTVVYRDVEIFNDDLIEFSILDPNGCDSMFVIQATMLERSFNTIDTTICEGETLVYGDITATTADTYEVTLTNAVGCDSIITVNLDVLQPTQSSMDEEICAGDEYDFFGTLLTETTTAQHVLTNAVGCDSTITLNLTVNPLLEGFAEYTLCEGEILGVYGLNADETGIYEVRLPNEEGCDSLITIDLTINAPEDLLELGEDIEIEFGDVIDIIPEFMADDLTNIMWVDQDGNLLGTGRELNDYKTLVDQVITVTGEDSNGCTVADRIRIEVNLVVKIFFPNVFSPNGDLNNDQFVFKYNEAVVSVEEIQIYDRWGELLYVSSGATPSEGYMGWDGTFKGQYVNPGVYVYYVTVNIVDGSQRSYAGDVTVIR